MIRALRHRLRDFFPLLLVLALLLGSLACKAQALPRLARIAVVHNDVSVAHLVDRARRDLGAQALIEGLREYGWTERANLQILWRSAEGVYANRPKILAELARLPVDVILVMGNHATLEARQHVGSIPIVMITSFAPVESKLVESLAKPGGNVTGLTLMAGRDLQGKRLALLKQAAPHIKRVAMLVPRYADRATSLDFAPETHEAARALGISLRHVTFEEHARLNEAAAAAVNDGADALFFGEWAGFDTSAHLRTLRPVIERHALPTMHCFLHMVNLGALMAYGPDVVANHRRAAYFVDRILRGTRPAELPIEQPAQLRFEINLKTARTVGISISAAALALADRVIE